MTCAPHPLDSLGTGVFIRRIADYPVELLARFSWACIAVVNEGRGALNRDPGWWADARAAGVTLTAFDWLPTPQRFATGLEDAITWSAEHGSACYVADLEREWHHEPAAATAYVDAARRACDAVRCGLGLTSFAMVPKRREWEILVAGCADLSVPQAYDRDGYYAPDYAARCVDRWQALGAQRIAVGRGAFVDPDRRGPEHARWRSVPEIARHRATTPPGMPTCWWPPAGRPRWQRVEAMVRA